MTVIFINMKLTARIPGEFDTSKYPELVKFVEKYRCPSDVESDAKKHFLKNYEYERIINAARMKQCITVNKLDKLRVPDKCLCRAKQGYEVLSQRIHIKDGDRKDAKLSLSEVQQMVKMAEETGFRDWVGNFDWDTDGKLAFYDLESDGFFIGMIRGVEGKELPNHCKFNYVASLMVYQHAMEPAAQEWLQKRLQELLNSAEGIAPQKPLPWNTKYDDSSIDFEKTKNEFQALEEEQQKAFDDEIDAMREAMKKEKELKEQN